MIVGSNHIILAFFAQGEVILQLGIPVVVFDTYIGGYTPIKAAGLIVKVEVVISLGIRSIHKTVIILFMNSRSTSLQIVRIAVKLVFQAESHIGPHAEKQFGVFIQVPSELGHHRYLQEMPCL